MTSSCTKYLLVSAIVAAMLLSVCSADCEVENCKACVIGSSTVCAVCNDGYFLTSLMTKCSTCNVANCATCLPENADKCLTCNSGYTSLTDGSCGKCAVDNCNSCSPFTVSSCVTCNKGYKLGLDMQCTQKDAAATPRSALLATGIVAVLAAAVYVA